MLTRTCYSENVSLSGSWERQRCWKKQFARIAINCYLQGCSFSEPRWIFAFQRTCNPCCRILDLSAAVKRIWMGRIFQFYGLSWRSTSAHHITDTLSFKMSGTNTGYVKPPPKVIHHFSSSAFNIAFVFVFDATLCFHPQQSLNPPTQSNTQASVHRQGNNGNQVLKKEAMDIRFLKRKQWKLWEMSNSGNAEVSGGRWDAEEAK